MDKENKATRPDHYTRFEYEPYKVIEDWGLGFNLGNVLKYIARAGHKKGVDTREDLLKAKQYLEFELGDKGLSEPDPITPFFTCFHPYKVIYVERGSDHEIIYSIGTDIEGPVEYRAIYRKNDTKIWLHREGCPEHSVVRSFKDISELISFLNNTMNEYRVVNIRNGIDQYGYKIIYKIGRKNNASVEYELVKYFDSKNCDDMFYLSPIHSFMCCSTLPFSSVDAALAYLNKNNNKEEVLPDE